MATFDVRVVPLDGVFPHPNADRLDLGAVGGYRVVVAKGAHRAGELVAYIPEASVLPTPLIEQLGLAGKLAGKDKNRVKAVRLRGELSQGLLVPARPHWAAGMSVMDELGIIKYEPPIPPAMAGEVYALDTDEVVSFDLENIKAWPGVLQEGEPVVFTEKLHGTFTMVGARPARDARPDSTGHLGGRSFVSSKGMMQKRLGLKHNEANARNLYIRAAQAFGLYALVEALADEHGVPVFVLGETFGSGVQDLAYGGEQGRPMFRAFSVVIGSRFVDDEELDDTLTRFGVPRVPVVYRGPFSAQALAEHTEGKEVVSGQALHIREGVVVTPQKERCADGLGRVALKSVSAAYLLRKDGTEYN